MVSSTSPELSRVRAEAGRIGGLVKASRYAPQELTAAATKGFLARFEAEVDPEGKLPEMERVRRATALRKAYMAKLALLSAQARRREARDAS